MGPFWGRIEEAAAKIIYDFTGVDMQGYVGMNCSSVGDADATAAMFMKNIPSPMPGVYDTCISNMVVRNDGHVFINGFCKQTANYNPLFQENLMLYSVEQEIPKDVAQIFLGALQIGEYPVDPMVVSELRFRLEESIKENGVVPLEDQFVKPSSVS